MPPERWTQITDPAGAPRAAAYIRDDKRAMVRSSGDGTWHVYRVVEGIPVATVGGPSSSPKSAARAAELLIPRELPPAN